MNIVYKTITSITYVKVGDYTDCWYFDKLNDGFYVKY